MDVSPFQMADQPCPCTHGQGSPKSGGGIALVIQAGFLIFAAAFLVIWGQREEFRTFSIIFSAIVLEAFPFMLLGTLMGGLIEVFVPRERITALMPENPWLTVFMAAGLGMIFPVCECAIVPVVRRLLKKGLPLGAAVAYLLGGPIVNPLVAASTTVAYAMSWQTALLRIAMGYMIAAAGGILMDLFFTRNQAVLPENHVHHDGCACCHGHEQPKTLIKRLHFAILHAAGDFFDIGRFLVMGAFAAAMMQAFAPRQVFASAVGVPIIAILLMMTLAVVLSLCSEADAFVAASFRSSGMPFSAQMAFMILGPMLDVKLILMYLSLFRKRVIITLCSMTAVLVFLSILVMEFFSP